MENIKYQGETLACRLESLAQDDPTKPAFICWNKEMKRLVYTRKDMWDKSRQCAAYLRGLGLNKGDIVCNTLVNSAERIILTFGIILAGGVNMHGQKLMADGEGIKKNWKDSGCKFIVLDPNEEAGVLSILEKLRSVDRVTGAYIYDGLPSILQVVSVIHGDAPNSFLQIVEAQNEMFVDDTVIEHDLAYLFCTSGSTGFAKLVPHSFYRVNEISKAYISITTGIKHNSVFFNNSQMGWLAGCPMVYPVLGITRVFLDSSQGDWDTSETGMNVVNILHQEKCDVAFLPPGLIRHVLNYLESQKGGKSSSLEGNLLSVCITGATPVTKATMKALGTICDRVSVLYGTTELGVVSCDVVENANDYEDSCVGTPGKNVNVKVLNEEKKEVPTGCCGEVYVRTHTLSDGYFNNEEGTNEAFLSDGWYRSSDIGHVNKDGKLFVYCRRSYALNYNGCIQYPGWVEAKIDTHPEIQKSIVIGVPDALLYDHVCACIIKAPNSNLTVEQTLEFCKKMFLTASNQLNAPVPGMILFFDEFPVNNNGKVDRKRLKETAVKRLEEAKLVKNGVFILTA